MSSKSIDELQLERDNLMQEVTDLKEKMKNLSSDNNLVKENEQLKSDNASLEKLIEQYKQDVASANELVANTMRNYSYFKNQPSADDIQKKEQEDLNKAIEDFCKSV